MLTLRPEQFDELRREQRRDRLQRSLQRLGLRTELDSATKALLATDSRGGVARFEFDARGMLSAIVEPSGRRTALSLDDDGNVSELRIGAGPSITIEHAQQRSRVLVAGRATQTLSATSDGTTRIEFADGTERFIQCALHGGVIETRDRIQRVERFEYDHGKLHSKVDGNGHRVHVDFRSDEGIWLLDDSSGSLERSTIADGRATITRNDTSLFVAHQADADAPLELTYSDGTRVSYHRDEAGRVIAASVGEHACSFEYDELGRLILERNAEHEIAYRYDSHGSIAAVRYPDGSELTIDYDKAQRPALLVDTAGHHHRYEYGSELTATRSLDGQCTETILFSPLGTLERRGISRGVETYSIAFDYDSDQRVTATRDSRGSESASVYDQEGQLVRYEARGTSAAFVYDHAGNRVVSEHGHASFDERDRLTQQGPLRCEYDHLGRCSRIWTSEGSTRFDYDARGYLSRVTDTDGRVTNYNYDAFGRRLRKHGEHAKVEFIWAGETLIREIHDVRGTKSSIDYFYLPGELAPFAMAAGGQTCWFVSDASGRPLALVDREGSPVWAARYDAFGAATVYLAGVPNPWRGAGHYYDDETALHYNRFRYYDPRFGRYLSPDPLGAAGAANSYSLPGNDPINRLPVAAIGFSDERFLTPAMLAFNLAPTPAPHTLPSSTTVSRLDFVLATMQWIERREVCVSPTASMATTDPLAQLPFLREAPEYSGTRSGRRLPGNQWIRPDMSIREELPSPNVLARLERATRAKLAEFRMRLWASNFHAPESSPPRERSRFAGAPMNGHPDNHGRSIVGDPVDVTTGSLFVETLLFQLSPLLRFSLHYDSASVAHASGHDRSGAPRSAVGPQRLHSFDHQLSFDGTNPIYRSPDGRRIRFAPREGFFAPGDKAYSLGYVFHYHGADSFSVSATGEPTRWFQLVPQLSYCPMIRIERAGDTVDVVRDRERVTRVTGRHESKQYTLDFAYGEAGDMVRVHHGSNVLAELEYDSHSRLTTARDALGGLERFEYDDNHRLIARTTPGGYRYQFGYDSEGRCTETRGRDGLFGASMSYEEGKTLVFDSQRRAGSSYEFDSDGVLTRIIDMGGVLTRERDPRSGRIVAETDSAGRTTRMEFDGAGALSSRVDAFGLPEDWTPAATTRTPLGWLTGSDRGGGSVEEWSALVPEMFRSKSEWLFASAAPRQRPSKAIDALGRCTSSTNELGDTRTWTFDATRALLRYRDGADSEWHFQTIRDGLVGSVRGPSGAETGYAYDDYGHVERIIDARGSVYEYVLDAKGRVTTVRENGTPVESYAWGPGDSLVQKLTPDDEELVSYLDHERGLPRMVCTSSGAIWTLSYDERGQLRTASSQSGTTIETEYDERLRLVRDTRGGRGVTRKWSYGDGKGSCAFNILGSVEWTITKTAGRTEIEGPNGLHIIHERIASGALRRQLGNGTQEVLEYDARGALRARLAWTDTALKLASRYERDGEGFVTSIRDASRATRQFRMDRAHRITEERIGDSVRQYLYDECDNVLRKRRLSDVKVGRRNRISSANGARFGYDAYGRISSIDDQRGGTHYGYDEWGQLVLMERRRGEARTVWSAEYDILGRRTRAGDKHFFWDGDRLAAEVFESGRVRIYVYAAAESLVPVAFIDQAELGESVDRASIYYVLSDHVGAPLHIEDANGSTVWASQFSDTFGFIDVAEASQIAYSLRWPGHYWDSELELHYNRTRHYDPVLARYLEPNPVGQLGGINLYAHFANPQRDISVHGLVEADWLECSRPIPRGRPEGKMAREPVEADWE